MISMALMLALAAAASPNAAPDAAALLRDADRARGGLEKGVSWKLTVESVEEGVTTRRSMTVRARGNDALADTLAPPRHKGEVILFNDRNLWFVKPGFRRPIAISARQRLQGEASNGDVASTNYARDYVGTVVGEEEVDGDPVWKLDLVARAKEVTYDRIRYWVSQKRRLGVKAEFLTVGGDLFKSATFEYANRVRLPGGEEIAFVSRMLIKDAMGAGAVTVLTYEAPRAETHAPSLFNVNNVVR
jgi:hypothetical protein